MAQFRQEEQKGIALIFFVASIAVVLGGVLIGTRYAQKAQKSTAFPSLTPTPVSVGFSIKVIDPETKQPVPQATLVFTTTIYCIQVVGVECPEPTPVVVSADENGLAVFENSFPGEKVKAVAAGYQESEEIELYGFDKEVKALRQKEDVVIELEEEN